MLGKEKKKLHNLWEKNNSEINVSKEGRGYTGTILVLEKAWR